MNVNGNWFLFPESYNLFLGEQCPVIPEPPNSTLLQHYKPPVPISYEVLTGLTNLIMHVAVVSSNVNPFVAYSAYGPSLPTTIKVPYEFSRGKGLLLTGFMGDTSESFQKPTVMLHDIYKELALKISLDPNFNTIEVWSPLNEVNTSTIF